MNRRLLLIIPLLLLQGCSTLGYYAQSIGGHLSLMGKSRPIEQVLRDPGTSEELRARLLTVQSIRAFSIETMHLPENDSYRSYADLNRDAVVWSLVAAPEFSVDAKTWCYPFIGCAGYRGYFNRADAREHGDQLSLQGLDVAIESVPAYSTIGWFDDPLPSTVIEWPEYRLAGLIFHELSHQLLYVKDDSTFNESFAMAVELAGVERWLEKQGVPGAMASWRKSRQREKAFVDMLLSTRHRLEQLYDQPLTVAGMRQRKAGLFDELKLEYQALRESWGGYAGYDRWFSRGLNNARLASIATYEQWVPAFIHLLQREDSIEAFYAACRRLAELPYDQRQAQLKLLLSAAQGR